MSIPSSSHEFTELANISTENWYLASSKPKQEARAVEQLENQGIRAYCPTIKVEKIQRGKKRIVTEALFTGYLFIKISTQNQLWHKVRSTRGIRDWVRFAGNVAKLPANLVEELISNNSQTKNEVVISRFTEGDPIRVLSGPFSGLKGIFQTPAGDRRAMILVEFLGQSNRLKVPNEQIASD